MRRALVQTAWMIPFFGMAAGTAAQPTTDGTSTAGRPPGALIGARFQASSAEVSGYYKAFVRHADGSAVRLTPPEASFVAFLNGDRSRMLTESAPRWDGGGPNIPGDAAGTFGVEVGNFPEAQDGDSLYVQFTSTPTSEQGVLADVLPMGFPKTLYLQSTSFPGQPEYVTLEITPEGHRRVTWTAEAGVQYDVYRQALGDTVAGGMPRRLYERIAEGLDVSTYTDANTSTDRHGYIVIPRLGEIYGPHSAEAQDYPATPGGVEAAVAYTAPFQVAVTWREPAGAVGLRYRVYRADAPARPLSNAELRGEVTGTSFLDAGVADGATYYYRVVAVNEAGIESEASSEAEVTVAVFAEGKPDLDVLYISRTPRYPRYDVVYEPAGYNPEARNGTVQHEPAVGEAVRYTAVIRNSGGSAAEGFDVQWYVNGSPVVTETFDGLYPRQQVTSVLERTWTEEPEMIRCELQAGTSTDELTTENNALEIRSNGLSFHFYAEASLVDLFERVTNPKGSYSFEDWAQVQVARMNRFFEEAVYPEITPNGIDEHVFLDTVSYYADGGLPDGGTHAPQTLLWDGQWGFTGDPNTLDYFENTVVRRDGGIDWALLHELGHQIGLIDLYNMDVAQSTLQVIEPRTGSAPALQPIRWDVLYYSSRYGYLMHGGYQNGFSDHSAGALQRDAGQRRGFFGEYLADIPEENTLRILDSDGTPVRDAEIWIYQRQDNVIPNMPKFRGMTDSEGRYTFPDRTDPGYEGGMRVANPFSTRFSPAPNVVGTNATLFMRVATGDSVGYAFMDVADFNVAYWSGDSLAAVYDVTVEPWHQYAAVGLDDPESPLPTDYAREQNYPNPFVGETVIPITLPKAGEVTLDIYDLLGRKVATLVDGMMPAGRHEIRWHADGHPSGTYLCRFQAAGYRATQRITLLR